MREPESDLTALLRKIDSMSDRPHAGERAAPDARDGATYAVTPEILLALKLALITERPLLLRGEPGSGKSSLASYVARNIGWRYYEEVITARTDAQDLLWRFDVVRRLADATSRPSGPRKLKDFDYVEPGVMWWVLDPESARRRGATGRTQPTRPAVDPNDDINGSRPSSHAVVLLDEIDKADPDVPNALLVPLGSAQFRVAEIDRMIPPNVAHRPRTLVIATTNEERQLPQAFVRRCIVLHLEHPDPDRLVDIATRHLRDRGVKPTKRQLVDYRRVADHLAVLRDAVADPSERKPSTAEFLDVILAMRALGVDLDDDVRWPKIEEYALTKRRPDATTRGTGVPPAGRGPGR